MATMTLENMRFESYTSKTAVKITTSGTYTFDNCYFDGSGTYEIETAHPSGTVAIVAQNGTTFIAAGDVNHTGAGTAPTIENNVDLTVTVKDETQTNIQNCQVAIYQTSDRTQLMNEDTTAGGIATEEFNYPGTDTEVEVLCRKASSGATKYKNFSTIQTIGASGLNLAVTMVEDPINNATT